jgi:septum formation protein
VLSSPRLILASASPRRRELLLSAGYDFEVHPADIDEDDHPPMLPADLAEHLAVLKARALADRFPHDVILAADTVVALGDQALGKPADANAAAAMLRLLSGTTHVVITGVAVLRPADGYERSTRVLSSVHMRLLSPDEIHSYVASNQWHGKAGGYGIQDESADPFVTRMTGSQSNIVGLPMEATAELLAAAGVVPTHIRPV